MPKNNRHGQAAVLSNSDYSKIRLQIKSPKYKLLLDLAWYTGERWGALCKLKVTDLYNSDGSVREYVTFRAQTRKASPDGSRKTRQVPVHPILQEAMIAYKPEDNSEWMFPNGLGHHITLKNADLILRSAVERAGLSAKGISTHSTRRSFITKLHKAGVDLYTIQKITGHQDLKALGRYVEIDTDRVRGAIATL
jgi:integrase/recombinase XerD